MAEAQSSFQIHLPQFEGPFDLLLFFIERDELNVQDIPIAKITADFLTYIHKMNNQVMDLASEFILMAAQLMKIKAAMLLPRPVVNEAGEEIDPRTELIDRLLLYRQFRAAAEVLEPMAAERALAFRRGFMQAEMTLADPADEIAAELYGVSLYKLLRVFEQVTQRAQVKQAPPRHVIQRYPYTLEQVRKEVLADVERQGKLDFRTFVSLHPEKLYVVFGILAILELVQLQKLTLLVGEGYNNCWLIAKVARVDEDELQVTGSAA